jgi:hypothetical protein
MTQVTPLAPQIVMGPPLFVTISDIRTVVTSTTFTVTFTTDQACQCAINWTADTDPPSVGGAPPTGIVNDAAATTSHSIVVTPAGGAGGKTYTFVIQLASTDSSGLQLRTRDGFVQLSGARAAGQTAFGYNLSVPVRFYRFGGTPPPAAGGGGIGNWNTYAWAQYNAKGTTYPTP